MIKNVIKKFNILLLIPILMIICSFCFNREKSNYYILEYSPPREVTMSVIDSIEENYTFFKPEKRLLLMAEFAAEEVIEESEEIVVKDIIEPVVEYVTHETSIYFTDEQLSRLPENYTIEDLRLICTMVYGECGAITGNVYATYYDEYNNAINEETIDASYMHKLTASVLLNRCKHKSFPDTIYDNIIKPRQYTVYYTYDSTTYDYCFGIGSNWYNVVNEVLDCLNGNFDVPEDVIYQSNFSNLGSSYYVSIYVDTGYFRSTSYYAYD